MATNRPFAYNPTHISIDGTYNIGDLAVGVTRQDYNTKPGGLTWWGSPDEEQGYVIAVPIPENNQPTPLFNDELFLSPTYKATDISLSNNNQTATQVFSYQQSVLSETLVTTNKVMFSVQFNSTNPSVGIGGRFIGMGKTAMNYNSAFGAYPGNDNISIGFSDDGQLYYNGLVQWSGLHPWSSGDIIDIAVDGTSQLLWIRVNGGYWCNDEFADPVTNTGGFDLNIGDSYPVLCPYIFGSMTIQNTPIYGVPNDYLFLGRTFASVKFLGTKVYPNPFNDSTFIGLTNQYFGKDFTDATEASTWLTGHGFWNSYPIPVLSLDAANYSGSGDWIDSIDGKLFTLHNSPTWSSSYGGYFNFISSSSQFAVCDTSLPSMSTWTVGVWHYYTGTEIGGAPCIVTETFVGGSLNYSLGNNNGGFSSGFFNGGWQVTDGYSLTPNNWYYIVGTYDGTTVKLYVNNTLVDSTTYIGTPTSSGAGIRLMERWDLANYWGGRLATVDIYNSALNQAEITSKWDLTKSRFIGVVTTNLQLYLDAANPLSYSGTGNVWYDLSGNGNDVTMQNSGNVYWYNAGYFQLTSNGYFNNTSTTNLPTGSSPYTLSVWVQLGSTWGSQGMISVGNAWGSGNSVNAFRTAGTNTILNYWWGNDFSATFSPPSSTDWFNFVTKWDGTDRSIWVNGVQIGTQTAGGLNVTNGVLNIGNTNNSEFLQGFVAQALIYDRALSSGEIITNFDNTKSNFGY